MDDPTDESIPHGSVFVVRETGAVVGTAIQETPGALHDVDVGPRAGGRDDEAEVRQGADADDASRHPSQGGEGRG